MQEVTGWFSGLYPIKQTYITQEVYYKKFIRILQYIKKEKR